MSRISEGESVVRASEQGECVIMDRCVWPGEDVPDGQVCLGYTRVYLMDSCIYIS